MKSIFVGNLGYDTPQESVRALFAPYGMITRVAIITDRGTGRCRGFGFVEMANARDGEKAIAALNGRELDGRTLKVYEAHGRAVRSSGGGFGRQRWQGDRLLRPVKCSGKVQPFLTC
jgi:RNA recognition motif-containing protein